MCHRDHVLILSRTCRGFCRRRENPPRRPSENRGIPAMTAANAHVPACPITHPLDLGPDGVNRPGLYPHALYHELREAENGVHQVVRSNGSPAFLVTRYDDVLTVLRDQATFSRKEALEEDDIDLDGTILGLDDAEHAAVRGVVADHFTPRAVRRLGPRIEAAASAQLAHLLEAGEPADLMESYALPYALNVISDLFGLPAQDRSRFRAWGEAFLATSALSRSEAADAQLAMIGYLATLIERRRSRPGDDLLSTIAARGAALPPDQLLKLPLALLVGGWETTASSIGTFTQVLLSHPYDDHETAYAYLAEHPESVEPALVELQRMFTTAAADALPRRATRDTVLPSGARLRAGDLVIPSHVTANYDPRVFPDPHRMTFTRAPNRHLSFGHGAHHCIGRHLSHTEISAAMSVLLRELPTLRLAVPAEDLQRKTGQIIAGPVSVPVAWT
ncbi:cytochrome P450 [Nonomuraea sp. NPDC049504]|uniref:cytochrome P450 n=1 Tax=Nonomuraea sp. NPDC049504 TaxID=3154729 RepID=UPI003412FBBB